MDYLILSDDWWYWIVKTYGISIGLLWAFLKAMAVLDPSNKTNKILDTFRGLIPGNKELARRASDAPEEKK